MKKKIVSLLTVMALAPLHWQDVISSSDTAADTADTLTQQQPKRQEILIPQRHPPLD